MSRPELTVLAYAWRSGGRELAPEPYQYSNRNDPETYIDTRQFGTEEPHPRALSVPDFVEEAVFEAPYNNLEALVQELTDRGRDSHFARFVGIGASWHSEAH